MSLSLPTLCPRQPLLGVALAAIAGVVGAEFAETDGRWALGATALLALVALTRWRSTALCWMGVAMGFLALHTLHHYGSSARLLAQELDAGRAVVQVRGVVWSEPEKPRVFSRTTSCHFVLKLESLERAGVRREITALLQTRWAGPIPQYGDRVALLGSASNLAPAPNPGQFDFPAYLRRQGIYSTVEAKYPADCRIEEHGHGNPAHLLAQRVTAGIRHSLELDLQDAPEIASLIESMLLGLRGDTLEETKLYFQQTGTMHLFAVSGLNVAMLVMIAFFLLKPIGFGRRSVFFILTPALLLYALITGLSASCLRAGIMGALVLGSYLVDRPPAPFNSLAAAAVLILGWDTEQLFSPGFQFSFVLVLVLLVLATRLQRWMLPWGLPDPFLPRTLWRWPQQLRAWLWRGAAANLSVSVAAWLGSVLFTAGYFHLFSLSTVGANLVAVPVSFLMLALGLASVLTGWWAPTLAVLFNNANWLCAKGLLAVVQAFAALPGSHTYVAQPGLTSRPLCEITVLQVGTGAATFLRTRRAEWLIDCGASYEYERAVLPFLRSRGVNRLDGLILTHGDAQHIGGASSALADLRPRVLVDSPLKDRSSTRRKLHADLAAAGQGKSIYQRGDLLHLESGVTLRVLYPPADLERSVADDKAFVLLLECAGTRVLFLSDGGFPTEQWLLEHEPGLRADVLIKGQHARDLSGTADFLAALQPRVIVASPPELRADPAAAAQWAHDVQARGCVLFPQEVTGAVTLELRGTEWIVRGYLNGQTFRSRAR